MDKILALCRFLGLHPLSAFAMVAIDWMLFSGEVVTVAVSWPVSIGVAVGLTVPCILIQRYGMKEAWGLAVGKGLLIGVLTAIPTSLPSIATFGGGLLGLASVLAGRKTKEIEDKK